MEKKMRRKVMASTLVVACAIAMLSAGSATASTTDDALQDELATVAPEYDGLLLPDAVKRTESNGVTASVEGDTIRIESQVGAFEVTSSPRSEGPTSSVESYLLDEASGLFVIRIENENAPREYDFDVQLPEGSQVKEVENGALVYLTESGEFLGGVGVPWARDSAGKSLPTWFEYADGTLTQHVDLDAVDNITYPVLADPINGKWLIGSAYVTNQGGSKYVVRAVPTAFGRQSNTTSFMPYHTADLKARLGTLANKVTPTIENQFHCHVSLANSGGGATWDMESWKVDMWWWAQIAYGCNPPDA